MTIRTHYDNLKIPRTATKAEIKRAYRKLCSLHHPDKHPEENRPQQNKILVIINESYKILYDDEKRRKHDEWIAHRELCERNAREAEAERKKEAEEREKKNKAKEKEEQERQQEKARQEQEAAAKRQREKEEANAQQHEQEEKDRIKREAEKLRKEQEERERANWQFKMEELRKAAEKRTAEEKRKEEQQRQEQEEIQLAKERALKRAAELLASKEKKEKRIFVGVILGALLIGGVYYNNNNNKEVTGLKETAANSTQGRGINKFKASDLKLVRYTQNPDGDSYIYDFYYNIHANEFDFEGTKKELRGSIKNSEVCKQIYPNNKRSIKMVYHFLKGGKRLYMDAKLTHLCGI